MARSRKNKGKKSVEEPETPAQKPPSTDQALWTSAAWNNGKPRILQQDKTDPYDPKLTLIDVGDGTASIDGKGIMKVGSFPAGGSPRVYVTAPNRNVRFSAEVMVTGSANECYLVVRSNHEDTDGEGGYIAYFNYKDKEMYFKKELTHKKGYSPRFDSVRIDFTPNKWHKISMEAYTEVNKVRLKATFNGKETVGFDDGTIRCANKDFDTPNSPINNAIGKWCFFRVNNVNGVQYRNAKVEQL